MDEGAAATPEQRREHRRKLQVPLVVIDEARQRLDGRTLDVSASGMAALMPMHLAPGTQLLVGFSLPSRPGGLPVQGRARVMHSVLALQGGGFRVGMAWTSMPDDTRRALRSFAQRAAPLQL